jgi:hypothetical protein
MRALRRSAIFISTKARSALGGQGCSPGPGHYPVEEVAELLAKLKASGDYDRILAYTTS